MRLLNLNFLAFFNPQSTALHSDTCDFQQGQTLLAAANNTFLRGWSVPPPSSLFDLELQWMHPRLSSIENQVRVSLSDNVGEENPLNTEEDCIVLQRYFYLCGCFLVTGARVAS